MRAPKGKEGFLVAIGLWIQKPLLVETGRKEESENEKAIDKNDKNLRRIFGINRPREVCTAKPSQSNGLVGILKVPQLLERHDDSRPLSTSHGRLHSQEPWDGQCKV